MSSTRAPTSRRAARSGRASAASSWAPSGATARSSRRTGPRTGCTARPRRCSSSLRAARTGRAYAELSAEQQAALQADFKPLMRANTYDAATRRHRRSAIERAQAIAQVAAHYGACSRRSGHCRAARAYAMRNDTVPDAEHRHALTAFFFWTAWAAVTERPGYDEQLHQQLAVRAAGGQRADLGHVPVDDVQHAVHDRRHRRARLALRAYGTARKPPVDAADARSAARTRRSRRR